MLSGVGGVSITVVEGAPLDACKRLKMLQSELRAALDEAHAFVAAPLSSSAHPFKFCGALVLPPISDVRPGAAGDVVDVEFTPPLASSGWVFAEAAATARVVHGLDGAHGCDLAPLSSSGRQLSSISAVEVAWTLLGAVGGALAIAHSCGLSFAGRVGPDDVWWCPPSSRAGGVHELYFALALPTHLNLARGALVAQQKRDIAALAASARAVLGAAGDGARCEEARAAELEFLLTKMEAPVCPTASQLVCFQALRLRCETWMLRRSIARGCSGAAGGEGGGATSLSGGGAHSASAALQTPPRSPVPVRGGGGGGGAAAAAEGAQPVSQGPLFTAHSPAGRSSSQSRSPTPVEPFARAPVDRISEGGTGRSGESDNVQRTSRFRRAAAAGGGAAPGDGGVADGSDSEGCDVIIMMAADDDDDDDDDGDGGGEGEGEGEGDYDHSHGTHADTEAARRNRGTPHGRRSLGDRARQPRTTAAAAPPPAADPMAPRTPRKLEAAAVVQDLRALATPPHPQSNRALSQRSPQSCNHSSSCCSSGKKEGSPNESTATTRGRSPRRAAASRGAHDAWMDSRLGDLSSMQAELARHAGTRTPTRERLTAVELLNHLRARTVVD